MGSGKSDSYSSSSGNSQPYAPTYGVVKSMFEKDKQDRDIYNPQTGYFKNPKAKSLDNAIQGDKVYSDGKPAHGKLTYVLNENNEIIFGKRYNPNNPAKRSPHPTLVGGKDPEVQCAGMLHFSNGKITGFDNDSGHFRPNAKSLSKVEAALNKLKEKNPNIFSSKYTGGEKYE